MINRGKFIGLFSLMIVISLILNACVATNGSPSATPNTTPLPTALPVLKAEVVFQVDVPKISETKQPINIDILDDVTGLAINPTHYLMEQVDAYRYVTRISFPIGSIIRYRFWRDDRNPLRCAGGRRVGQTGEVLQRRHQ